MIFIKWPMKMVFDFSAPGKSCMIAGGVNIGAETLPVDTERVEDCLYAKIIARKDAVIASDQRNVLKWIHGTFNFNSVDATYENPDNLVAEHDLIVAKINYRLGQLIYFTFDLEILSWKQNLGVVIMGKFTKVEEEDIQHCSVSTS